MVGIATHKNRIQLYMENIRVYPDPNERQAILAYLLTLPIEYHAFSEVRSGKKCCGPLVRQSRSAAICHFLLDWTL